MKQLLTKLVTVIVLPVLISAGCSSTAVTFLVPDQPKDADAVVKKSMQKFGSVSANEENEGYLYSYDTGFMHPFDVKYYIGSHLGGESKKSIVRIEGEKEDTLMLQDIISQDYQLKDVKYEAAFEQKSLAINHTLNIISPGLAYMYGAFGTPRRGAWEGVLWGSTLLLSDFVLYVFSANAFFFNTADSLSGEGFKKNLPVILVAMGGFRLANAYFSHLHISGHNGAVNLGYKFRFYN